MFSISTLHLILQHEPKVTGWSQSYQGTYHQYKLTFDVKSHGILRLNHRFIVANIKLLTSYVLNYEGSNKIMESCQIKWQINSGKANNLLLTDYSRMNSQSLCDLCPRLKLCCTALQTFQSARSLAFGWSKTVALRNVLQLVYVEITGNTNFGTFKYFLY